MYDYSFSLQALKEFKKLPKNTQKRLIKKLDFYCASDPLKFAQPLTDSRLGSYRFRVGNFRIIFDLEGKSLVILAVGDRKEIYK